MKTRVGFVVILCTLMVSISDAEEKTRHINLPGKSAELPFSDAVLVGDTLYLSGKLGLEPGTRKVPEQIEREIKLILDGMNQTLEQAQMSMDHLVYVQVFCPDLSLYEKFNSVYRTYFKKNFPARAFIGSGPLLFGAHFEVQGIARK